MTIAHSHYNEYINNFKDAQSIENIEDIKEGFGWCNISAKFYDSSDCMHIEQNVKKTFDELNVKYKPLQTGEKVAAHIDKNGYVAQITYYPKELPGKAIDITRNNFVWRCWPWKTSYTWGNILTDCDNKYKIETKEKPKNPFSTVDLSLLRYRRVKGDNLVEILKRSAGPEYVDNFKYIMNINNINQSVWKTDRYAIHKDGKGNLLCYIYQLTSVNPNWWIVIRKSKGQWASDKYEKKPMHSLTF